MADNEQSDESRRRKWLALPSWERKDHPDLIDLIDVMRPHERERYEQGFVTPQERDNFLAQIGRRWYELRDLAKERPKRDSPHEDAYDSFQESTDHIKAGLLELKRRLDVGELVEVDPSKPKPKPVTPSGNGGSRHPILAGVFSAVGALILNQLNVPLKITIPFWVVLGLCIWQWPRIVKTRARQVTFWAVLSLCSIAILAYIVLNSSAAPQRPVSQQQPPAMVLEPTPSTSDVSSEYLIALYSKHNSAQADELVKSYIGKRLEVSGVVSDVFREQSGANVVILIKRLDGWTLYAVNGGFQNQQADRALMLTKDEKITIEGEITRVSATGILLKNCRFID